MAEHTFGVTADVAFFSADGTTLLILLVERGNEPFRGKWALPGGFVEPDEDLAEAAARELEEETGLAAAVSDLTEAGVYGKPGRDPRMRVVTVVYSAYVGDTAEPVGGDDAADARFWPVREVLDSPEMLAFDHHEVIAVTVERMRLTPR